MKKELDQSKPTDEPQQQPRKYEKPLTLAPLTFIEAVRKIAKAQPVPRQKKPKTKPA